MAHLILASTSPRRKALLKKLGAQFDVVDPGVVESASGNPELVPLKNAVAKARAVAELNRDAVVVAADTVVTFNSKIFDKPQTPEEARTTLAALAGHSHQVTTAVAVIVENSREFTGTATTRVFMRAIAPHEMDWYIATGEPIGKAGAYGIQGRGAVFIDKIDGCFYNVVGLPLSLTVQLLRRAGFESLAVPEGAPAAVVGTDDDAEGA